tara:strand:+ start:1586 stop:1927 length:342 start_codon:yes stop_codon:yes gene_type:complete
MNVGQTLIILLGFFVFAIGSCSGQVSVIHFNSEWNAENSFDISTLKDCKIQNITICHSPELQEQHNIVSVPTIILFENGEEVKRFQANLMMELKCKLKDIQTAIDKIYLAKFE